MSAAAQAESRVFTDTKGRQFEGEIQSATEEDVTVRRRDGRVFTVRLDVLSESDREAVSAFLADLEERAEALEMAKEAALAREQVVKFSRSKLGEQVGNGECWTLADEAFQEAGISRPAGQMRVWGREIDHTKEDVQPGDIVEIEAAEFDNGVTFPVQHTSVVVAVGRRGMITVCECNMGGDKRVQENDYNLRGLKSGTVKLYRYEGE